MKALIVDDHEIVRDGLRRLLAALPNVECSEASTAREAMSAFRAKTPDVTILDLNLPDGSGFELLRRMLIASPQAQILVFTMHAEPLYVARLLEAGAKGFISKSASSAELVAAIKKVGSGGQYVERDIAAHLVLARHSGTKNPYGSLTTREADIMRQLGEGKTPAKIAASLGVTYKTVANSCSVIKAKLGVERVADLIRLAIEMGEH